MNRISTAIANARTAARRLVRREHDGQAEADLMNRALAVLNGEREPTPGDEREAAEVEKSRAHMYERDVTTWQALGGERADYMGREEWDRARERDLADWREAERAMEDRAAARDCDLLEADVSLPDVTAEEVAAFERGDGEDSDWL